MGRRRKWTEDEIQKLRAWFDEDIPEQDMAAWLGRSIASVAHKISYLGLQREQPSPGRKWSDEEKQYVLEHYRQDTIHQMARDLGVSWPTVQHLMREMGLRIQIENNKWTPGELQTLQTMAADGKSIGDIAEKLGKTENVIRMKARKSGIMIYQPGRIWSVEDLEYLRRSWGYVNVAKIARTVHRGVDAVCQQAHKMKLPALYSRSEDIPLGEFCRNTGISRDRIINTLALRYDFPLVVRKYGKRQYNYFVDMERIMAWLEKYQVLYDASKFHDDFFAIMPDWLKQKKREDMEDNTCLVIEARRRPWTDQEIADGKLLIKMGWSYQQVAERFGRNVGAVKAKLRAEGAAYTLKMFWTGKEFKYLNENWENKTDEEIGQRLGRTAGAVAAQRESLGLRKDRSLSDSDRAFISEHWQAMSDMDMAAALGKSVSVVASGRHRMKLYRDQAKRLSEKDIQYIAENWESMSDEQMAVQLGKTKTAVLVQRKSMGLYRKKC